MSAYDAYLFPLREALKLACHISSIVVQSYKLLRQTFAEDSLTDKSKCCREPPGVKSALASPSQVLLMSH